MPREDRVQRLLAEQQVAAQEALRREQRLRLRGSAVQLDSQLADEGRFVVASWGDDEYGVHVGRLFAFFRGSASGRYSDSTMMRCARAADDFGVRNSMSNSWADERLPLIAAFTMPYSYDPDTEVKKGGTLGMMATWPDKAIIAVHESARRKGVGSNLYRWTVSRMGRYPVLWAGRNNDIGQHFLLAQGLVPTAMNSSGSIRYSRGDEDD